MIYAPDDFTRLSNLVIQEGGKCLEDECVGTMVKYKIPTDDGGHVWSRRWTTHCNFAARMEIPYDGGLHIRLYDDHSNKLVDHTGETGSAKLVTVCAVDDCVGLWPRYQDVVSDKSYQL
jgi:hypothetical protein